MILQIAWKNIWRNKIRSLVVIFSIAIGLLAGILSVSVMNGAVRDRVDAAIRNEISSVQLHNPAFLGNSDINDLIVNSDDIIDKIADNQYVSGVSGRLKIEAMVNSGHGPRGAIILGVDPKKEKTVSQIFNHIPDSLGGWFNSYLRNPIVISARLAEKLKVKLNSKIQIDAVSKNGDAVAAIFRVVGIYSTDNAMFDELYVFVDGHDLIDVLEFDSDECHEIAILTKDIMETDSLEIQLKREFTTFKIDSSAILTLTNSNLKPYIFNYFNANIGDSVYTYDDFAAIIEKNVNAEDMKESKNRIMTACENDINVLSWGKLSPEIELTTFWMDYMLLLFVGIILLSLGFGIVNTMLMVVLERVKELGMLMAIGMNRLRVFKMVMLETLVLTMVGGLLGIFLSSMAMLWLQKTGINLSSMAEGFNSVGYSTMIYPYIGLKAYIQVVVMVVLTGILSAIYPAWKAVKLNPADAVRSE